MRLPRWTVYPALVVLAVGIFGAIPRSRDARVLGVTTPAAGEPQHKRVVVLGIDGLDPEILEDTIARYPHRMRNFSRLIAEGWFRPLGTSIPPQSPVAWSNFITGRNPGGHGVFDFIHRDPMTRGLLAGSVRAEPSSAVELWSDWQFPIGGGAPSNRSGESFWVTLARHGIPADVWRMPANFPVEPAQGLSYPGMMTPAVDSAYGTYTIYTTNPPVGKTLSGGTYVDCRDMRGGVIRKSISGPPNSFKQGTPPPNQIAPVTIYVDEESRAAAIKLGERVVVLAEGQWSDFMPVEFELLPMGMSNVSGIVRFYLRSVAPEFELYASPVNIDPMNPVAPVAEPTSASAELVDAIGYYYTQGMAEEVNALKDEAITEREFMEQTRLVYDERVRMMDHALDLYLEDEEGGLFFFYYSTVDLSSHMMWHVSDDRHPFHAQAADFAAQDSSNWSGRAGSTWEEVLYDIHLQMDPVLGRLRGRLPEDTLLIVMSDHGFAPWYRKFSLNTWLLQEGYLVLKDGYDKELPRDDAQWKKVELRKAVDWSRTRAYGMGFNGLYLNLAGRELDDPDTSQDESGIVLPGKEAEALLRELKMRLEGVRDVDGTPVVLVADVTADVYAGERLAEAPDIQVGYNTGYGNADASSMGRIPNGVLVDNLGGTFNGNHLMASEVVKGSLIATAPILEGDHALEDLTVEILKQYGIEPLEGQDGHPVLK